MSGEAGKFSMIWRLQWCRPKDLEELRAKGACIRTDAEMNRTMGEFHRKGYDAGWMARGSFENGKEWIEEDGTTPGEYSRFSPRPRPELEKELRETKLELQKLRGDEE